jgi:hypothetical protein
MGMMVRDAMRMVMATFRVSPEEVPLDPVLAIEEIVHTRIRS